MLGCEGVSFIEFGSGDCSKISILLGALPPEILRTITYVPVDVSLSAIEESRRVLERRFGVIEVRGIVTDFTEQIERLSRHERRIFCFFGSTIGNLDRSGGLAFVSRIGGLMRDGERFLLGLDMVKDGSVLERAYNDAEGVTAQFNRNILNVVNTITGTSFDPRRFEHLAFYNDELQRIELYLVAREAMEITSPLLDRPIQIRRGETIHTEHSHKFTEAHIHEFAEASGLAVGAIFTDADGWFSVVEYVRPSRAGS